MGVLPRGLFNAWDLAFVRKLTEADAAKSKISHKASSAATFEATVSGPSAELGLLLGSSDY
jgi:hypothetical protein